MPPWMPTNSDAFDDGGTRIENSACQIALRVAGRSPGPIARAAGIDWPTGKLTFAILMHHADFPIRPAVSAEPMDDVSALLTKFPKTRLKRAWTESWQSRPDCPAGLRFMLIKGVALGTVIVSEGMTTSTVPHIVVCDTNDELVLSITPFRTWCQNLTWAARIDGSGEDDGPGGGY